MIVSLRAAALLALDAATAYCLLLKKFSGYFLTARSSNATSPPVLV
jgi:hypothetical protein